MDNCNEVIRFRAHNYDMRVNYSGYMLKMTQTNGDNHNVGI